MVRNQLILMPSSRFVSLEFVRRHVFAVAPVNDHRFLGTHALGGAGGIHRRIAAAVNRDPAAQFRCGFAPFHRCQVADGVQNAAGIAGRDVDTFCQMRAYRDKCGIEVALSYRCASGP